MFVSLVREADQLHLSVEDDSVGFDAATVPQGQGIELADIRSRVQLLDGTLEVKSQPGRGFFLELPMRG